MSKAISVNICRSYTNYLQELYKYRIALHVKEIS